jgi:hypothetical protein
MERTKPLVNERSKDGRMLKGTKLSCIVEK